MHFLLTSLKVYYVLRTPQPREQGNHTLVQTRAREKWENDEYVCHAHILNGISDALFDTYQNVESAFNWRQGLCVKKQQVRSFLSLHLTIILCLIVGLLWNNSTN
ncbi:hypothetical protein LIER_17879 [Lithospermum erythrorhizon]|uniref:Uncharacterized protein n=1 Tax=Lithospermum erythrorhizon TaxID=34254 RepID=A0AAV3QD94_LITER